MWWKSPVPNLFWYLSCLGLAGPLGRTSEKLPCPSPSGELRPTHEGSEGACNRQFCKLGTPEALCRAVRPGDDDRWRGRPPLSSYPLSSSISKHRSPMWEGKSFHFPDRLSSTNCLKWCESLRAHCPYEEAGSTASICHSPLALHYGFCGGAYLLGTSQDTWCSGTIPRLHSLLLFGGGDWFNGG